MRLIRLAGLAAVAVVVIGVAGVPSASAFSSNPLFVPASGQTVTGEGGKTTLSGAGIAVSCTSTHLAGGVVSTGLLLGGVVLHYLGCEYTKGEEESGCPANSTGQPSGLILTNTLHGILGLLLPSGETGIVFLPVSGATISTLEAAEKSAKHCSLLTKIQGDITVCVEPVGTSTTHGTIKTLTKEINEVDLTHHLGLIKAKLIGFGGAGAVLEQQDSLTFSASTEVT